MPKASRFRFYSCILALTAALPFARAEDTAPQPGTFHIPAGLVDLKTVDPTIVVELRYATKRNVTGAPIYPAEMPCLVRPEIAKKLQIAQARLQPQGFRLKIWDGWRPQSAQRALWELIRDPVYVANPDNKRSMHNWGVAVDATMVDAKGRDVKMPTDFDDFTRAASMYYPGPDLEIRRNLKTLQNAMGAAGFRGMGQEWWHFVIPDWRKYGPVKEEGPVVASPSARYGGKAAAPR